MILTLLLATEHTSGLNTDWYGILLQAGPVGLFLLLFILRKIRTDGEVREKDAQIERLQKALDARIEHYEKEVIPAMLEANRVGGEMVAYLNKHRD